MVNPVEVELRAITKRYGEVVAADHVNLKVKPGKLFTLLGPSGCGKTTILRMIGGFIRPDEGQILIGGEDIADKPPNERDCGFVFQSYALFPHMTVRNNIGYGLKLRKWAKNDIERKVHEVASLLRITELRDRYPRQLSGGQQQRVALARALAIEPRVFLWDEPLSNLDAKLRDVLRFELRELQVETKITTIYVTHDQAEALILADELVVMNMGRIEQIGRAFDVYGKPLTPFVADFIGRSNFFDGKILNIDQNKDTTQVSCGDQILNAPISPEFRPGDEVMAVVRPEKVSLFFSEPGKDFDNSFRGKLESLSFLGDHIECRAHLQGDIHIAASLPSGQLSTLRVGQEVFVAWRKSDTSLLSKR